MLLCILTQEELKGKHTDAVRRTLKLAVLKGNSKSRDLIVVSNYDQKPFYMVSHSIGTVTWLEKEKLLWSTSAMKNVVYKFLRCNVSDDYNFEMNDNDVADQYRLI